MSPNSRSLVVLVPLVLLVAPLTGCGPPTGNVSGTVSYQGKPLPGGFVVFVSKGAAPTTLTGAIQADGTYSISGLPLGPATITVQGRRGPAQGEGPQFPGTTAKPPEAMTKAEPIFVPDKYSNPDQSGLSHDVVKGKQTRNIDLE